MRFYKNDLWIHFRDHISFRHVDKERKKHIFNKFVTEFKVDNNTLDRSTFTKLKKKMLQTASYNCVTTIDGQIYDLCRENEVDECVKDHFTNNCIDEQSVWANPFETPPYKYCYNKSTVDKCEQNQDCTRKSLTGVRWDPEDVTQLFKHERDNIYARRGRVRP